MPRKTTPKNARWGVRLSDAEVRKRLVDALSVAIKAVETGNAEHLGQAWSAYNSLASLFRARSVTRAPEYTKQMKKERD